VLKELPEVELFALAESDPVRRKAASKRAPKARAFASYEELLLMPGIDAVVICLPNNLHAEATLKAMEHGKHVYLEKPLATSLSEAQDVLQAWQGSRLVGMIGFNYRFNSLYQTVKQHCLSGRLGELVCARSVFSTSLRALPNWKNTRQSGGGVLLDLASHHFDLLRYLFEVEVKDVFANVWSHNSEDDSAALQIRLANGLVVQSFFSLSSTEEDRFEIYGQSGKLSVDRYFSFDVEISDSRAKFTRIKWLGRKLQSILRSPYLKEKILAPGIEPSFRTALAHFISGVKKNQPVSPDFWDGYQSLALIEAAEKSARTHSVVSIDDFLKDSSLVL
jgi:predicted dehydrogenase